MLAMKNLFQKTAEPVSISYLETRESLGEDAKCYLQTRVNPQISWLSASSGKYKKGYMRYRVIALALSSLTTILPSYMNYKDETNPQVSALVGWIPFVVQLASASATLSLALLSLNRSQENWVRYRSSAEALEREKLLFLTRTTETYSSDQAFQNFVLQAEAIMQEERSQWTRQMQEPKATEKVDNSVKLEPIMAASITGASDLISGMQAMNVSSPSSPPSMQPSYAMAPLEAASVPSAESAPGQGSAEQAELPIGGNRLQQPMIT